MKAQLSRPNYEALNDEQLELLVLEWMCQELDITPEGAPLVLIMLGGRIQDEVKQELVFDRARTIELSQSPEELVRAFSLLDDAVAAWLATYLPAILSTKDASIAVNSLQVMLCTDLEESELPYFILYLSENGILEQVRPHPWGEPHQTWHLHPDFIETYQRDWTSADAYRKPGEDSIVDQFLQRLTYTNELALRLAHYLEERGVVASSAYLLSNYEDAAAALNTEVSFIMDAERVLMHEWAAHAPITVQAQVRA